jgi:hypothetical protein
LAIVPDAIVSFMAGSTGRRRGLGSSLHDILDSLPPAQRHWLTAREPVVDAVDHIAERVLDAACAAVALDVCAYAHRTNGHGVQVRVRTDLAADVLLGVGRDLGILLDGPPRDLVIDIGPIACAVRVTHGPHSRAAFVAGRAAPVLASNEKHVLNTLGDALAAAAHTLDG